MELNETELGIINRAFEKMPFPDDPKTIDLLREKIKTGIGLLFDNNGESAENLRLDTEANEYAANLPIEQELFDKDGNAAKIASKESAAEVLKVCSALEKYRQDFFKTPKTIPTHDEIRSTLDDFRLAWQYLTPENKKKMEGLAETVGYDLPENLSKRIVLRRKNNYDSLQEMAKVLKKDKNNLILKNKLTTQSGMYVANFFDDAQKIMSPKDLVDLCDMAFNATKMIAHKVGFENSRYVGSYAYFNTRAKILEVKRDAYRALGDQNAADLAGFAAFKCHEDADRVLSHGHQIFEKSANAQTYLK